MCVRNSQFQVAPKDHRLHGTGRPTARICHVKVAPKGQGIQVFGRPCVAVSIHVCVGYNGLADQLLLRERTCDMCAITRVWPTKKHTWLHARI